MSYFYWLFLFIVLSMTNDLTVMILQKDHPSNSNSSMPTILFPFIYTDESPFLPGS